MSVSIYKFRSLGLGLNNLKVYKTKSREKDFDTEEKINRLGLTFNPGLALTGFRTTRPSFLKIKMVHSAKKQPGSY